ncbi:hypothetical protein [Geodermatophilus sp. SYSU D00079]
MATPDIYLWDMRDVADGAAPEFERAHVTDICLRSLRPPKGARIIGLARDETGISVRVVGVIAGTSRVTTGKDRFRVQPLVRPEPVPWERVTDSLSHSSRRWLDLAFAQLGTNRPQRLSHLAGQEVLASIRHLSVEVEAWMNSLAESETPQTGPEAFRLREERDAVGLAISLADLDVPNEALQADPAASAHGLESAFAGTWLDHEDDALSLDLGRFDTDGSVSMQQMSVARFTAPDFVLEIANVNLKPLDVALGVDLIYRDMLADTFTLLQYKRLTPPPKGSSGRWRYVNEAELERQLDLMDVGESSVQDSRDWRLSPSPFWFKFLRADAFTPNDPLVLPGMYVHADYLRMAISDGSLRTGPRGGFQVNFENTRHISRSGFVELVRRGMAGTTSAQSDRMHQIIMDLAQEREVVVATKRPLPHRSGA